MDNFLYIGLNGYAGAGKDTVAKMLYVILNYDWKSKDEAYNLFKTSYSTNIRPYATLKNNEDKLCTCIAFADRLKQICADMFGVPIEYFYYNKSNSWICINKDFEYTEQEPELNYIVTADDYYSCKDNYINSTHKYYMSLREILVYVGTYVCQFNICRNIFVNSVGNTIQTKFWDKSELKYIICTDVRFIHEYNFIKRNNGIMINIVRDSVKQASDIAEHEMDVIEQSSYNYVIKNNGTYEDLFDTIWTLTHSNEEFKNECINLRPRDNSKGSYLRLIDSNPDCISYKLCMSNGVNKLSHSNGDIVSIDPVGGPTIFVGDIIQNKKVLSIEFVDKFESYVLHMN